MRYNDTLMIDEDRTMQLFGYTSEKLSRGSDKKVVAVCDECGRYRVQRKRSYRGLCHPCKMMTGDMRNLIAERQNNPSEKIIEGRKERSIKMLGRTLSGDHRRAISEACKKIIFTKEHRKNISRSKTGRNHHNWKGGVTSWRNRLYHSKIWKEWRTEVFKRDDYTCQMCGERGGELQPHHIQPVRDHKNDLLIFDVNNGITLCKKCHSLTIKREYEFIDQFNDILVLK